MKLVPRAALPCFAVLLALAAGCGTEGGINAVNPTVPVPVSTSQLRVGDSLTIALLGVPDPSTNSVQIDEQGLITLPFIGALSAAGASTAELSQRIRETYVAKKIYTVVDVSVNVTERYVYVGGEVQHPSRLPWSPDLTVAKETAVSLVRDKDAYSIDVKLAQKNPAQDPRLMPGDSLQVARSPF